MKSSESKLWEYSPVVIGVLFIFLVVVVIVLASSKPGASVPILITPSRNPTNTIPPPTSTSTILPTPIVLSGCAEQYSIRIRSTPGINAEILGGVSFGECVSVFGRNEDSSWVYIKLGDIVGWAAVEYLSIYGEVDQLSVVDENGGVRVSQLDLSTEIVISLTPTKQSVVINTKIPTRAKTSTPRPLPTAAILLCKDTYSNVGSNVTCKIPRAYCSYQPSTKGKPTFCNDARYPNNSFALVVWGSDWSDLDGRCIIVSGRVNLYDGKSQIEATSRSQVTYCQ
jgi:Bacterial SH3 domain